jgi:S-adenosylmethionine hydrolase
MGALTLASAVPYFPIGTIHVAVVDPGVGTRRRPIIIETSRCFYVGPDNGLLMLSAERLGIRHIYKISNPECMLPRVSKTFHGRDVFAPAAAYLGKGRLPSDFGYEIYNCILPHFVEVKINEKQLTGEILYVDSFGNIITNISAQDLKKIDVQEGCLLMVKFKCQRFFLKLCSAYGEGQAGELLAIIGSHDFFEIALNKGSAAQKLKAEVGTLVRVSISRFSGEY